MSGFYYLYCVKDKTQKKFSLTGTDKKKVFTLPYKDIEAVLTGVNKTEFNPKKIKLKLEDLKWTEAKVINHQNVIEEAMKDSPVIPLKFLTLYKTKESLKNVLEKKYKNFRGLLDKLREKAEWGLKVYVVDKEKLTDVIKKEDEEIAKIKAELAEKPEGVKYFLEKKVEERVSEKVNVQLDKYIKDIFEIFLSFSVEKPVINRLLPQELVGKGREMILNLSYLVPDEKAKEFKKTVGRLHDYYSPKGLWLEYSGPFPPYSFVDHGPENKKKV